ncbi:hypothetical protein [Arthrobacter sp. GMC3]|uniref:hypothetical protein n=1 Tax=Arthrobacter sp. GMC3 TaxID=2058894 RepID=UPI0015E3C245|nr:hypothetical protein [Arthrobacter sp. GMC3]
MSPLSLRSSCTVAVTECNDTNGVAMAASPATAWILLAILGAVVVLGVALWLRHRKNDRRPRG